MLYFTVKTHKSNNYHQPALLKFHNMCINATTATTTLSYYYIPFIWWCGNGISYYSKINWHSRHANILIYNTVILTVLWYLKFYIWPIQTLENNDLRVMTRYQILLKLCPKVYSSSATEPSTETRSWSHYKPSLKGSKYLG